MLVSFAGAAGYRVSKSSGPAGQKLAPGKRVDELGPFRRFAGETLVTRFSGQEQTTTLPTVVGVCNHPDWHKKEGKEEEEKAVVNDPVDLDFFVTETAILCREKRCLLCRGRSSTQGSLKVSPPDVRKELMARTPPIKVVGYGVIQRAKRENKLVRR